jgi:diacylglycerol O-acyltransferase
MIKQALSATLGRASNAFNEFAAARLPSNRLTGQDALFLHLDQPHAATHGTMIYIYDQSTVPGKKLKFQDVLRHIQERLSSSPLYRNKIAHVPGNLGYPYWVEDENFDIDFHVRHFALPKPNDWRQFCILASRIHARTMDMNRPLWEMYIIEGLDNVEGLPKGSFAILTKLHHAATDGTALAELTWALHDVVAGKTSGKNQAVQVPKASKPVTYYQADKTAGQTLFRIAADNLMSVSHMLPPLARVTPKLGVMATQALRKRLFSSSADNKKPKLPHTRFNKKFDGKRVFESVTTDMADIKAIRAAVPGATVNDAVLAVIGGSLRRYLDAKGELPNTSLIAAAPINTRKEASERQTTGNSISFMTVPMGTQIADPLARLEAVLTATTKTKEVTKAVGARELTDISKNTPPATLGLVGRLVTSSFVDNPIFNCIVSNVPGPVQPLCLMGANLVYWSGVMPISEGSGGLFFAVSSYCGKLFISPTSSPVIVPDPEFLAQCLRESIAETVHSARQRLAAPTPAAKGHSTGRSTSGRRQSATTTKSNTTKANTTLAA